jgi:uncharacterized OB-fold protein
VTTRSIDLHVFQTDPALRLIAGRERRSGRIEFPAPEDPVSFESVDLPARGLLWSFTVQRIAPKSPPYHGREPFAPFAIGYVELPGALIVESRLTDLAFDELHIGMTMTLTALPLYTDPDGTQVLTYAFCPDRNHPT